MTLDRQLNLKKFTRLMTCSALALGLVAYAGAARAAAYELDSGVPITITATANMLQSVTINQVVGHFGQIGVEQDPVEKATLTLNPNGTVVATSTDATKARIVTGPGAPVPAAGRIDVTGAFPNTSIFSTYAVPVNLSCALCAGGNPLFQLFSVSDDMGAPIPNNGAGPGTGVTNGNSQTLTEGQMNTNGAGSASFAIGAVIKTIPGATFYGSGTYNGSVNLTLSY